MRFWFGALLALALGLAAPARAADPVPAVSDKLIARVQDAGGPYDLRMNIYMPHAGGPARPLLLYLHGKGGSYKAANDPIASRVAGLTARGIVVARIDYRPSGRMPEMLYDAKAYVRYFRAHAAEYNIDPLRIAVWGVSRGGTLAAMLAATGDMPGFEGDVGGNTGESSRVQSAVIYYPLTDLWLNSEAKIAEMLPQYLGVSDAEAASIIKAWHGHDMLSLSWDWVERINRLNPMTYIDAYSPPVLIACGAKDTGNPIVNSQSLFDRYVQVGIPAEFYVSATGTHGHVGDDIEAASRAWIVRRLTAKTS